VLPAAYPSPTERAHRTVTCLAGAARLALLEWPDLGEVPAVRETADLTRSLLDYLAAGDTERAAVCWSRLDAVVRAVPSGAATAGFVA
jgi:hypothetical protein